jgi:hypothetical protein
MSIITPSALLASATGGTGVLKLDALTKLNLLPKSPHWRFFILKSTQL